jgi:hypothetical protein
LSCCLPRCTRLAVWCRAVESLSTVAVLDEWSIMPMLYCSRIVAVCAYVLHALTMLFVRMSCRPMMALTSGALETSACVLGTCMPSCIGGPARLFYMLEACGPQGAVGHVAALEPTSARRRGLEPWGVWQYRSPPQLGGEVQSHRTRGSDGAHLTQEARSGVVGHVAARGCTLCYLS